MHTDLVSFQSQFQKTIQQLQVKHLGKKARQNSDSYNRNFYQETAVGVRGEVTPDIQLRNRLTSA